MKYFILLLLVFADFGDHSAYAQQNINRLPTIANQSVLGYAAGTGSGQAHAVPVIAGTGIGLSATGGNLTITNTVAGSVRSVNLTPGLTTQVGVCNSSLQAITTTGQVNEQQCFRTVTTNTSGSNADSGYVVKMNCNGCVYTAINPSGFGGNQGVFFDIVGDGNASDTFVVTTAGATANFLGCPLGGSTTVTMPGNGWLHLVSNPDNAGTTYYACAQFNGTTTVTTTNNYSGNPVLIASQTATVGATTELDFIGGTNWSTSFNALIIHCFNLAPNAAGNTLVGEIHSGGSYISANYYVSMAWSNATSTVANGSASTTDIFNTAGNFVVLDTAGGTAIKVTLNNVNSTTQVKAVQWQFTGDYSGGGVINMTGSSEWQAATTAIDGFRIRAPTGTFGGICTISGEN